MIGQDGTARTPRLVKFLITTLISSNRLQSFRGSAIVSSGRLMCEASRTSHGAVKHRGRWGVLLREPGNLAIAFEPRHDTATEVETEVGAGDSRDHPVYGEAM